MIDSADNRHHQRYSGVSLKANPIVEPIEVYKFLMIYDFGDDTLSAELYPIKNLSADLKKKGAIYGEGKPFTKEKVYLVYIK